MFLKINNYTEEELKTYLLSLRNTLTPLLKKYFKTEEYKQFTRNIDITSRIGEENEKKILRILENFGMTKLYQGSEGDFIDMRYGIDFIMSYKSRTILCQVKRSVNDILKRKNEYLYHYIDYFIAPTKEGIIIMNHKGESFKMNKEGKIV